MRARGEDELRPLDYALIIIASAAKWPLATEAILRKALSPVRDDAAPAAVIAGAIMYAVEECSDKPMVEMHNEISKGGRAGCCTGLIWMCRRLKFIEPQNGEEEGTDEDMEQPPSKRVRAKSQQINVGTARRQEGLGVFKLGRGQIEYRVSCGISAIAACQRCVEVLQAPNIQRPRGVRGEIVRFGDAITKCTAQMFGMGVGYQSMTVARKVIVFAHGGPGDAFDSLTMKDIMPWLPDLGGHTDPLAHMTCRQARQAFGVAPMLISGWACIMNSLSPEAQAQLMISEPLQLLRTLERLRLLGVHTII